jgi:hypothetical protein
MQPEKTGIDQERAVPGNRIPTAPEGVFGLVVPCPRKRCDRKSIRRTGLRRPNPCLATSCLHFVTIPPVTSPPECPGWPKRPIQWTP